MKVIVQVDSIHAYTVNASRKLRTRMEKKWCIQYQSVLQKLARNIFNKTYVSMLWSE